MDFVSSEKKNLSVIPFLKEYGTTTYTYKCRVSQGPHDHGLGPTVSLNGSPCKLLKGPLQIEDRIVSLFRVFRRRVFR